MTCDVAPLFWCFIVRFYHPRRSTRMLVSVGADIRIGRRRHPHRSTQTSASVGADIRIGRRRHPHRSAQTSASVGADIRIGRRRCINRRVWHPCHTHAATPTPSARHLHAANPRHLHAADCVGIAGMLYPPIDSADVTALPDIRA